ncbi:MAG TPA: FAD-binding oxidoreductase [Candidatus Competibacter sp.]|nr:FAD-binding oxidoreductase [Candidatus Competibacteraceae bacterium]HPE72423.1 FAD-binding oxidoreductase [Candidatus Competibacter sp.]HRW66181.1 FAD-binding oxidoreductase [Candidatus Competibacter sp.]
MAGALTERADTLSWGRYPHTRQTMIRCHDRHAVLPATERLLLPFGNGRSYGDSCLNDGGTLLHARGLDRFVAFNPQAGVLHCEAGVLLSEILELVVPQGWFLPVTPGTQFVTVGGAIANDVHGKNHHRAGTFGAQVRAFELLRSDGSRRRCSPTENPDWFTATVGGLGLTGLIVWAEIQLRRIANSWITSETIRFHDLDEFFAMSAASDRDYEYTVAWLDCSSGGAALGRGLFIRGNHAPALCAARPRPSAGRLNVPFVPPFSLINRWSLRAFNTVYYHRQWGDAVRRIMHYAPFFYPLDRVRAWNRIYGRSGFLQYQCAIPTALGHAAIREVLERIARSGTGSVLAVLKIFGAVPAVGWLSFPRPGVTLALDFPNRGPATFKLLDALDAVVATAGGAVYPAKDARMSGARFREFFPQWHHFSEYIDPQFSSSFWRRVMRD